jgi:excisionase family DNA binding protein
VNSQEKLLEPNAEWLSLSETANMLGIHPSTLRSWADKGRVPVHRTAGGHRRFRKQEIELWAEVHHNAEPIQFDQIIQQTVRRTRLQIAEGRLEKESWYQKIGPDQLAMFRNASRRVLQTVVLFVTSNQPEQHKDDVEALGREYARMGKQAGWQLRDILEALQFFEEFMMDSFFQQYEQAGVASAQAWGSMRRRVSRFMHLLTLSIVDAHE